MDNSRWTGGLGGWVVVGVILRVQEDYGVDDRSRRRTSVKEMREEFGESGPEQGHSDDDSPHSLTLDRLGLRHSGREGLGESRPNQGHNDDDSPRSP